MKNTKQFKQRVLLALEKHLGVITAACKEVGLSRHAFYEWYKEDEWFKSEVDKINDYTLDFVENQLLKKIREGSEKSIHFYLRYKGRTRGYSESVDITSGGDKVNEIKLIQIKKDERSGD